MILEEFLQRVNKIVDSLLVGIVSDPFQRYSFTLPSVVEQYQGEFYMDCQEGGFGIARLREAITYKYLLSAFGSGLLDVTKENLCACIGNMRRVPVIDYFDWADYHAFAASYYKGLGNDKKADMHLLSSYICQGRAQLSCNEVFDTKDIFQLLLKNKQRLESVLIYIIDFICHDFSDFADSMERSQFLFLEEGLKLAVKEMAEDDTQETGLRSCIYYAVSVYYKQTKRPELAKQARNEAKKLRSKRNLEDTLEEIMQTHASPRLSEERFMDYLLFLKTFDESEIFILDEEGNVDLEADGESSVWEKDERVNFFDAYYREMPDAVEFKRVYDKAENGDKDAVRELVRRYAEGDGVKACKVASEAWMKVLEK